MRNLMKRAGWAIVLPICLGATQLQAYPDGPIEMIVPFSAGGGTDTVARLIEPEFSAALNTPVIIRNVTGAAGTVGAKTAVDAKPDGQTIAYMPVGPVAIQPLLRPDSYDADSWQYVCRTVSDPVLLMVRSNSELTSLEDVKAKTSLVYGSAGAGSVPHIAMAALSTQLGIEGKHIPYKGTANAMNAMAGGEVEFYADLPSGVHSFDVKPLAIFASARHPSFPDVPSMAELGYELEFGVWHGILTPAETSSEKVAVLSEACKSAVNSAAFKGAMEKINTSIAYQGPEEFKAFVLKALAANKLVLKNAGLIE